MGNLKHLEMSTSAMSGFQEISPANDDDATNRPHHHKAGQIEENN